MKKKMNNREIAIEYLRCFCAGETHGLESLLATDLSFVGTFHTYYSASEYLDSLRRDPPEECGFKILSVTEDENSVAIFYEYQKPERVMQIAQLFRIKNNLIKDVLLVFDGRGFD